MSAIFAVVCYCYLKLRRFIIVNKVGEFKKKGVHLS